MTPPSTDAPRLPLHLWWTTLRRAVVKGLQDQVGLMAGGIAFFAILALAPALIALVALFGLTTSPSRTAAVAGWLADALPETARPLVLEQLQSVVSGGTGSLTTACVVAGATALWSASGSTQKLLTSIQWVYDRPETRGTLRLYSLAVVLALGAAVFMVVAVALLVGTPALVGRLGTGARVIAEVGRWVLLALLVVTALAVVYRVSPDRDGPRWRWLTPGAVVAGIGWLAGSVLFSIYVDDFASYGQTYGALAGVAVVMLWLYLTAYVVLMGAEINAEAERLAGSGADE
ncbi:MAG TPA: YihY/virulence factor BrkB family protein [Actinomycetospora sp.]|jgi:membrane protein|uniref:YihY/virulence factor BrkB family protein n=1 Tax=Actinomycetospora sp. TaxID=1872135 RepID=UPI002F40C69C